MALNYFVNQGGINPTGLSLSAMQAGVNDASAEYTLGTSVTFPTGEAFVYVQVIDGPTTHGSGTGASNGAVLAQSTTGLWIVTADVSGGTMATNGAVIGIAQGDVTTNYYTWAQYRGETDYVRTDGSVAIGDSLVNDVNTDEEADTFADGEAELIFGIAGAADDANGLTSAMLFCW